jgi:hypothetical protein
LRHTFLLAFLGLGLGLWIRFLVEILCQFPADISKIGHRNTCVSQTFLRLTQLVIGKLQLAEKISNTFGKTATSEQVTMMALVNWNVYCCEVLT